MAALTFPLHRKQKVIVRQRLGEGSEGQPYEFIVESVSPEEVLLLPVDEKVDIASVFTPGEIVIGFAPGDPPYQFQSVVIRVRRTYLVRPPSLIPRPISMLLISAPEQVAVVERRRYFRVRVLFEAKVAFVLDEKGSITDFYPTTGLDISSMGVGLHIKPTPTCPIPRPLLQQQVLVTGSLPSVRPEFPDGLSFEASGEVRNITEMGTGWRVGIMFTSIERRTQDLIVAWCFAFQRRLKREGLPVLEGEVVLDENEAKEAWQR
jgi:c-di-GMP-binding flagellar brake protein YcgR